MLELVQSAAFSAGNPTSAGFGDRFTLPLNIELTCRIIAVPVLIRALTSFLTGPLSRDARSKMSLDVMTLVGAATMVVWYLVVGPSVFEGGETAPAARLFIVVLPVTDAVLLLTCLVVSTNGQDLPEVQILTTLLSMSCPPPRSSAAESPRSAGRTASAPTP